MWVPKKIIHVNDVKANTQGPHVRKNTKKRNTKNLKENICKVYNSIKITKSLNKGNISQVFYPKKKREVAYNKNKERRHIGNLYPKVEERRKKSK